ncbi:pentatricopeptide repeat-containing protein 2, mitochondrial [Gastrophryne carolinensis]
MQLCVNSGSTETRGVSQFEDKSVCLPFMNTHPCGTVCIVGKRYLLANDVLKFDSFLKQKQATLYSFPEKKDVFFKNLASKLENSEVISDRELKPMLYLCETESDVQLAKRCVHRYYEKVETMEFKFGPLFLRLCYEFGLVDTAFELLMDKSFRGAFSDSTSFNILLDMLYHHGHYERALEALLEMKTQRVRFSRQTYLLAFAICYELNSPRSLETCTSLVEEAVLNGIVLSRLSFCFVVALALKQGQYDTALSVYNKILKKDHSLCCNLGLLIAAHTDSEDKVLQILESANEPPRFEFLKKLEICKEVMDVIEETVKSADLSERFNDISDRLRQSGQISALTLDGMLQAAAKENDNMSDSTKKKSFKQKEKKRDAFLELPENKEHLTTAL